MTLRALVTGGAGFIGSHISARLLALGAHVRILDNMSSGRQENLDACSQAEFHLGDITSERDTRRASDGCEVIFHHAALVSVQESINNPQLSFDINVRGTLSTLLAAHRAGVRRFIFASSAAVYGDAPELPKHEAMVPTPISPYGADKAAAEAHVTMAHRLWGMETVVLRYFNIFGPRQDPNGEYAAVIPKFIDRLVSGRAPVIFGDGQQTRDFLSVADVVEANLCAAQSEAAPGGVFNIARGTATSLLEVLDILQRVTGLQVEPEFAAPRPGDIRHSTANAGRAAKVLGFEPRVPLPDGLAATADYFRRRK